MAAVEYRHVDKVYADGVHALKDFCLRVDDGEMMVLVGPSGCGKSTALRLLAGLEPASGGELLIGGQRVNERAPQQRDTAMVFQNYALYPHMTVYENLEFPLRMKKLAKTQRARRVDETAQLLGLTDLLQRRPRQLSGGQRQRVAMGRAMVRHPQVFLMDEPLSNLDAKLRIQIRAEIASLQRRLGITSLYVTHDQVEAMTLGDRIAVLNAGRLQQVGPPQELYDRPANTFVAAFMGNPGMNILSASVDRETSSLQLNSGGWSIPLEPLLAGEPALARYLKTPLLVGVRPEAFSMESPCSAEVVVESVESLGHERLVYFKTSATSNTVQPTLVARMPVSQMQHPGQTLQLGLDAAKLYFFTLEGDAIS